MSHHQDTGKSHRHHRRLNPDAWMAKVVVGNVDPEPKVNRRLDFDDRWHCPDVDDAVEMPTLTTGQSHHIVCDMGIPILYRHIGSQVQL
jgi:hypothetical protein